MVIKVNMVVPFAYGLMIRYGHKEGPGGGNILYIDLGDVCV